VGERDTRGSGGGRERDAERRGERDMLTSKKQMQRGSKWC
jgi:hypothetical protein